MRPADDKETLARLGSPDLDLDDVRALQDVFVRTGALDEIEVEIDDLVGKARAAISAAPLAGDARAWLDELAVYVAWRDR